MKPDATICRVHPNRGFGPQSCRDPLADPHCDPVPMVWSADSHALLEVVECDCDHGIVRDVVVGASYGDIADLACPKCGGSGWRYAANTLTGFMRPTQERRGSSR